MSNTRKKRTVDEVESTPEKKESSSEYNTQTKLQKRSEQLSDYINSNLKKQKTNTQSTQDLKEFLKTFSSEDIIRDVSIEKITDVIMSIGDVSHELLSTSKEISNNIRDNYEREFKGNTQGIFSSIGRILSGTTRRFIINKFAQILKPLPIVPNVIKIVNFMNTLHRLFKAQNVLINNLEKLSQIEKVGYDLDELIDLIQKKIIVESSVELNGITEEEGENIDSSSIEELKSSLQDTRDALKDVLKELIEHIEEMFIKSRKVIDTLQLNSTITSFVDSIFGGIIGYGLGYGSLFNIVDFSLNIGSRILFKTIINNALWYKLKKDFIRIENGRAKILKQ